VKPLICALATALVVALGGCGGDDDDAGATTASPPGSPATTSDQPMTTEEHDVRPEPPADQSRWASQVDAACKSWQERIDAVAPPLDATALERWLTETLPLARKQLAAVEQVKPPAKADEAERAKLFVGGLQKLERALTRYLAALRAGDAEAIQRALAEANAAGTETRGYALSLDVTECGGYASG
jgi:hypothetical protein